MDFIILFYMIVRIGEHNTRSSNNNETSLIAFVRLIFK